MNCGLMDKSIISSEQESPGLTTNVLESGKRNEMP